MNTEMFFTAPLGILIGTFPSIPWQILLMHVTLVEKQRVSPHPSGAMLSLYPQQKVDRKSVV